MVAGGAAIAGAIVLYVLWRNGTLGRWWGDVTGAQKGATQQRAKKEPAVHGVTPGPGGDLVRRTSPWQQGHGVSPSAAATRAASGRITVAAGDTLSGIAARYGISLSALEAANPQIENVKLIYPGETVTLPGAAAAQATTVAASGGGTTTIETVRTGTGKAVVVTGRKPSAAFGYGADVPSGSAAGHTASRYTADATRTTGLVRQTATGYAITRSTRAAPVTTGFDGTPYSAFDLSHHPVGYYGARYDAAQHAAVSAATHTARRTAAAHTANQANRRPAATATVQRGQTLWGIAMSHRLSLTQLERANPQIRNFGVIYPGEKVYL